MMVRNHVSFRFLSPPLSFVPSSPHLFSHFRFLPPLPSFLPSPSSSLSPTILRSLLFPFPLSCVRAPSLMNEDVSSYVCQSVLLFASCRGCCCWIRPRLRDSRLSYALVSAECIGIAVVLWRLRIIVLCICCRAGWRERLLLFLVLLLSYLASPGMLWVITRILGWYCWTLSCY